MELSLANIHILGGDESQIHGLLPRATTGRWSDRFVSVFSEDFSEIGNSLEKLTKSKVIFAL